MRKLLNLLMKCLQEEKQGQICKQNALTNMFLIFRPVNFYLIHICFLPFLVFSVQWKHFLHRLYSWICNMCGNWILLAFFITLHKEDSPRLKTLSRPEIFHQLCHNVICQSFSRDIGVPFFCLAFLWTKCEGTFQTYNNNSSFCKYKTKKEIEHMEVPHIDKCMSESRKGFGWENAQGSFGGNKSWHVSRYLVQVD